MRIIIVGCGRMGKELIETLSQADNHIVAIDYDAKVFTSMPVYRNVTYKVGTGFDKDVLESADIKHCDAVISCTESDETNALIARIARNIFLVPKVIARLYNSKNATIYSMLGVQTISTTEWGTKRIVKLLNKMDLDSIATIGDSDVEVIKISVPPLLVGKNIKTINSIGCQVVSVLRNNNAFIPELGTIVDKGDELFIAIEYNDLFEFKKVIGI